MKIQFKLMACAMLLAIVAFPACETRGSGDKENNKISSFLALFGSLSSAKAITAFSFESPAATGTINETDRTIAVSVPFNTERNGLVPTITVSPQASVSPASGVPQNFTVPVTYTVTAENGTKQGYTVSVETLTAKKITAFDFASPAATGVIDENAKTVAVSVPWNTVLTSLAPTITHTGSSISPASGAAQDFSSPKTYTVTAGDSSEEAYTITVTKKEYALRGRGPANGWIFYINPNAESDGWKYLEAAPADQSAGITWQNAVGFPDNTGATATAIGTGLANTNKIISIQGSLDVNAAAKAIACRDGGYSDWFLPSIDELAEIHNNLEVHEIGDFNFGDEYWSSTEYNQILAWSQTCSYHFGLPDQGVINKAGYKRVRAVRAF
jgi:hypothetical protein